MQQGREGLVFQPSPFHALRGLFEQQAEGVFGFPDAFFDVGDRGGDHVAVGLALHDGCLVHHPGFFHGFHRLDGFPPQDGGFFRDGQLPVEHQQRVVGVSDGRDHLCLHGLAVGLALQQGGLGSPLGVGQLAEQVDFPARDSGKRVGLRGGGFVEAAHRSLGR